MVEMQHTLAFGITADGALAAEVFNQLLLAFNPVASHSFHTTLLTSVVATTLQDKISLPM
jgi:hypothetical protein